MLIRACTPVAACAALLILSGCSSPFATNWMPVGYTYEDDTPISTPAPSQPWMKDAVIANTDALATSTVAWQGAVFELVDKIAPSLPAASSGPLILQARPPATAQKQALDHYLRQALIQRGYTVAVAPTPGALITYDAQSLETPAARAEANARLGPQAIPGSNMKDLYLLSATMSSAGRVTADSAVIAVLSGEKREYNRWPGFTTQPAQGKALKTRPVYLRD